jgi:hypothetical protein
MTRRAGRGRVGRSSMSISIGLAGTACVRSVMRVSEELPRVSVALNTPGPVQDVDECLAGRLVVSDMSVVGVDLKGIIEEV